MTLPLDPPIPLEEMSPEELSKWEQLMEDYADAHPLDSFDTMEEIRKLLNSSQIEAMHMLKKSSRFGVNCTYYQKAKLIFIRDHAGQLLSLLDQLNTEIKEENILHDRRHKELKS